MTPYNLVGNTNISETTTAPIFKVEYGDTKILAIMNDVHVSFLRLHLVANILCSMQFVVSRLKADSTNETIWQTIIIIKPTRCTIFSNLFLE